MPTCPHPANRYCHHRHNMMCLADKIERCDMDLTGSETIAEMFSKVAAEATRIERERCLKAVEDAWETHQEGQRCWDMDRSYSLKVEIKARIEAGTTGGV